MKPVKIKLLSITKNPETTLFKVWIHSRPQLKKELYEKFGVSTDEQIDDMYYDEHFSGMIPEYYTLPQNIVNFVSDFKEYVNKTVSLILDTSLPPAEAVTLTWQMDNVSVALREQLVRHRSTSPWVQSSRNNNDSLTFEGFIPDSALKIPEATQIMEDTYQYIKDQFAKLLDLGVPSEDARMIMPEGRQHGLCWTMTLRDFYKVMKERACWIAQGIWKNIFDQMVNELRSQYYELFASRLGTPPCKYGKCVYKSENENRLTGADILPVCPLYCKQCGISYPEGIKDGEYYKRRVSELKWDPKVVNTVK